jgi:hypothetical protein
MSWQESGRDVHGDLTYVTFRCGWCRRFAVATEPYKPSRCCCAKEKK